jgi:nifR3 family TIM-barrel protein
MLQIGNLILANDLIMAPLSGVTNLPFRRIVKQLGPGLVTSEMVSAMGLVMGKQKTLRYLKSHTDEKPLSVQLFGAKPEVMASAAEIAIESGADIVDINMGCPARKVVKTGAGGALLRNLHAIEEIISSVRKVCSVPLTVKIRTGWSATQASAKDIALLLEDCGADAITVHPRFVTQGFSGLADWTTISKVKKSVNIPVIGNGDITTPVLAAKMKTQTGCDGVMIGRAAVGNPWIFKQILALERGLSVQSPTLNERRALILEHFQYLSNEIGENRAAKNMRGLLLSYTKGLPHSRHFRSTFTGIQDLDTLVLSLDTYFSALDTLSFLEDNGT